MKRAEQAGGPLRSDGTPGCGRSSFRRRSLPWPPGSPAPPCAAAVPSPEGCDSSSAVKGAKGRKGGAVDGDGRRAGARHRRGGPATRRRLPHARTHRALHARAGIPGRRGRRGAERAGRAGGVEGVRLLTFQTRQPPLPGREASGGPSTPTNNRAPSCSRSYLSTRGLAAVGAGPGGAAGGFRGASTTRVTRFRALGAATAARRAARAECGGMPARLGQEKCFRRGRSSSASSWEKCTPPIP